MSGLKKRSIYAIALLGFLLLVGCSKGGTSGASADVQAADAQALAFIKATVEADHEQLKNILAPDSSHYRILEAGTHMYPGAADRLKERYQIDRFSEEPSDKGELYYKVRYYRENHNKDWNEYLRIMKIDDQWKVYEIKKDEAQQHIITSEGAITVHEYKEGEQ